MWSSSCYAAKRTLNYTKASDFLLKVFSKEQGVHLIIDNDSCENIISTALVDYLKLETESLPSIHLWVDKEGPLYKDNESLSSLFQLASFIKIKFPAMLIWMHVTDYWDDHDNMTSMLPIKARGTSICSLGRARELP